MKALRIILFIALGISLPGLIFKVFLIPGDGIILTLGLVFASQTVFVQFILSFFLIKENTTLKVLSALMSLTLSFGFVGIFVF